MTTTALFRDFLILNKAKQKFERNWNKIHPSNKISWKGDFLTHYMLDTLLRSKTRYWRFLAPRRGFSWDETNEGYDFWSDISSEWDQFIRENKDKIAPSELSVCLP